MPAAIDQSQRLAVLESYGILDTPSEPAFDDAVTLARIICHTPIALVSLVAENRQWFKARAGLDACETPIEQSVCAHAIRQGSTLIIPDLTRDPRTRDNTLVTSDPKIRFYAGALLTAPGGALLGTLCVIDTKPRPEGLTEEQLHGLEALARHVVQSMDMRRIILQREDALFDARVAGHETMSRALASEAIGERLKADDLRRAAAQEAGQIGTFETDLSDDTVHCSAEFCRIAGLPVDDRQITATAFDRLVIPEDRTLSSTAKTRRDETAAGLAEYRIRRANDGAVRWISRRGDYVRDDQGRAIAFTGAILDITERKLREVRQQALISLGDELRRATSVAGAVDAAPRLFGSTLGAARAGYANVDLRSGSFDVVKDWTAHGVESLEGHHPVARFAATFDRLQRGEIVSVANVPDAVWLGNDIDTYAGIGVRAHMQIPLIERQTLVGVLFVHDTKARIWTEEEEGFARTVADRVYATVAKLEAEHQQQMLNEELSHRLKNTLALVQAIASQTLRDATDPQALAGFRQRLLALSKAHDVLMQQNWSSARIKTVINGVLSLQADLRRLQLSGPDIALGPKAVLSLSMLLHELATNAVKYGALSVENGSVRLSWETDETGQQPMLVLCWEERGGPPAQEPTKHGMGSRLIRLGLVGTGTAVLRYDSAGFQAEFRAPLALVTEH